MENTLKAIGNLYGHNCFCDVNLVHIYEIVQLFWSVHVGPNSLWWKKCCSDEVLSKPKEYMYRQVRDRQYTGTMFYICTRVHCAPIQQQWCYFSGVHKENTDLGCRHIHTQIMNNRRRLKIKLIFKDWPPALKPGKHCQLTLTLCK